MSVQISRPRFPEGIVKLAQALLEERADKEYIDLTNAVAALGRPKVYETVLATVCERVGENPA